MNVNKKSQAHQFHAEYERLCFLQDICPVSHVTANLKENFLDLNVDKIRANEWNAILEALKVNNSLRYVALRSFWSPINLDDKKRKSMKKKTPPIRSRDMTLKLTRSLKDCLFASQCLECLVIQNLPLREQDIRLLAKGICKSMCLKYLSLEQCCIGDECFEILIICIKTSASLLSVNFSGCNLTWKSAEHVAVIIKYQASQRHGEAWQDSLRYRRPDLDRMHGLRRITLCDNMIADHGARILADALKDDLWLKALDLQNCSISSDGAQILKESLSFNRSLWILDLRRNQQIVYDLLRSIIEQVMINAGGEHAEYPWISSEETRDKLKSTQKKSPYHNVSKKSQIRSGKVRRRESIDSNSKSVQYSKSVHYPWRTGERIKTNRFKSKNPLDMDVRDPFTAMQVPVEQKTNSFQRSTKQHTTENIEGVQRILADEKCDKDFDKEMVNKLQVEVHFYKQKYNKEKELRLLADDKLFDLEEEKKGLEMELSTLKSIIDEQKEEKSQPLNLPDLKKCGLDDDQVLDGIEASFERFQQFLDMLEDLGLGDLYNQMQQQQCK